jgi:prepilin-type N-terminal cleavage/methylation domain-containing protein
MKRGRGGFTLIELMIAVAILAIVAAIAVSAYNGYIRESRLGAMRMNLDTLRIAVEAFRLDSPAANYGNATFDTEAKILNQYGWRPEGDNSAYLYTVVASSTPPPFYRMSAAGNGLWMRCDKDESKTPSFACCDGKGTTTSCCLSSGCR